MRGIEMVGVVPCGLARAALAAGGQAVARGARVAAVLAAFGLTALAAPAAPAHVEEVAEGVFVRRGLVALPLPDNEGVTANSAFIVGDEAVAVIDPGGSAAAGASMLQALRSETDLPIRYVIYTHMHPDHVLGTDALLSESAGASIVAHARLPRALAARAEHYLAVHRDALGDAAADAVEIRLPDRLVEAEAQLELGGRRLLLRAWPTAHTDNDLTVLDEATGTLLAGDLLFLDHLPVVDGSLSGWLDLHVALSAIEAVRAVPGHGPAAAPWPDALAPQRRYLSTLRRGLRAEIEAGTRLSDTVEDLPAPAGTWSLVDAYHRRNATAAFAELEWE